MDPKYTLAIIAGLFGVVSTVLVIFQAEIRRFLSGSDKGSDLIGQWTAKWEYDDKSRTPTTSRLDFEKLEGNRLHAAGYGSGDVEHTKYLVEGWNTPSAICLSYISVDSNKNNIVGTLILKKELPDTKNMSGNWWELSDKNEFYNGSVILTRK